MLYVWILTSPTLCVSALAILLTASPMEGNSFLADLQETIPNWGLSLTAFEHGKLPFCSMCLKLSAGNELLTGRNMDVKVETRSMFSPNIATPICKNEPRAILQTHLS